jgi:hypothetical protein
MIRATRRRVGRAVLVKNADAFDALYIQLQTAMTNAWDDAMREGIANALDRLRDLGPGQFTKEDGDMIMRILEASVGPDAIRAAMREPVVNLTDALFRVGAEEVGQAAGVAIAFMRPDLDALDVLKTGNLYWVGNSWNIHTQNLMAKALEDYFTEGMPRDGLTQRFAEDFAGLTKRGQRYWEILADHTATKTREIGRVTGYERAGIVRVQVRAHLDDRTTKICRHMHGRIIEVGKMREQADAYLDAAGKRNEPAAKAAWTMHGADADLSNTPTSKLGKGTASPPYHFRCRTITVAYFASSDPVDQIAQSITDREKLSKDQVADIRTLATGAAWMEKGNERRHWKKHGSFLEARKLADYEASARGVVRNPSARLRVSMRVPEDQKAKGDFTPRPYATFAVPHVFTKKGGKKRIEQPGHLFTAVRLDTGEIVTHHWRDDDLSSRNDITPARDIQKALKGLLKWLFR